MDDKRSELQHTELVDEEGNPCFEEAFLLTPEEVRELQAAKALVKALGLDKEQG